ncbi:MAG: DDE transposase family protein [Bacteroidetes bacterium]|nr:DDE transposase family protein [Bacteroidota bacterium]
MSLSIAQKKEWAKLLFLKENLLQKEIALKVGVTEKTLSGWINKENWEQLRTSLIITKEEELRRIYIKIGEITTFIMNKEEGQRFANSKKAYTLNKLDATARSLETDTSIAEIIEVAKQFIVFVRKEDNEKSKELTKLFDEFIKSKLR